MNEETKTALELARKELRAMAVFYGGGATTVKAIADIDAALSAPAAPVAPAGYTAQEWTDAKLRGIASDYFHDAKDWPAAMRCMRHLLMEQGKAAAPVAQGEPVAWRDAVKNLVKGFEHVSSLALQWEPVHLSVADDDKWMRATEAWSDIVKMLAAPAAPVAQGEPVATLHADGHWTHPTGRDPLDQFSGKVKLDVFAAAPAAPVALSDSTDFIRRTNEDYAAWCATYYVADSLDRNGMRSLNGLWAWQEQERRKRAAPAAPVAHHVGDTKFEGWLSCHEPDRNLGRVRHYSKQDMRDAYWAGYSEAYAAPAAPVAQPLTKHHVMTALAMCPTDMSHPQKCEWIAQALNDTTKGGNPAAPVAKPLTDEQIAALHSVSRSGHHPSRDFVAGVRAAERAHGITKEGGAA